MKIEYKIYPQYLNANESEPVVGVCMCVTVHDFRFFFMLRVRFYNGGVLRVPRRE